jgi:hypothetical protein
MVSTEPGIALVLMVGTYQGKVDEKEGTDETPINADQ